LFWKTLNNWIISTEKKENRIIFVWNKSEKKGHIINIYNTRYILEGYTLLFTSMPHSKTYGSEKYRHYCNNIQSNKNKGNFLFWIETIIDIHTFY